MTVGGGNFWRPRASCPGWTIPRSPTTSARRHGDERLALQDALEPAADDQGAVGDRDAAIAEPYIRRRAVRHLEKGRVVIFAAGTEVAYHHRHQAALRAAEIDAEALLKGTHSGVDGVYDSDPRVG